MEYTVRALVPEDFMDVVENYYSFYEEVKTNQEFGLTFYERKPDLHDEFIWFGNMLRGMKEGNIFASVAVSGGRVVGMCSIMPLRDRIEESHIGILGIAIAKGYRNAGIGTALMQHAFGSARNTYEIIVLDVFTVNTGARHLYQKLGFRSMGILPKAIKRKGKYYDLERMYMSYSSAE